MGSEAVSVVILPRTSFAYRADRARSSVIYANACRVEDGRVGSSASFPVPAHQTGRVERLRDFRAPRNKAPIGRAESSSGQDSSILSAYRT
jgi:hypothetical protein